MEQESILFNTMVNPDFDAATTACIRKLIDGTVGDDGTLGFAETMTDLQIEGFVENLRERIAQNSTHVLLGICPATDAPVFMVILTQNTMPNCRHIAELSKGVVHPDFRGRRVVKFAFSELVKKAQALGIEKFVLDVREHSRAHELWKAFGFVTFGLLEDYARVAGKSHRGHYMEQPVADLAHRLGL